MPDDFPASFRCRQIQRVKRVMPYLLPAIPWHHAVGEIRASAGEKLVADDSGEGSRVTDGIRHRRQHRNRGVFATGACANRKRGSQRINDVVGHLEQERGSAESKSR